MLFYFIKKFSTLFESSVFQISTNKQMIYNDLETIYLKAINLLVTWKKRFSNPIKVK